MLIAIILLAIASFSLFVYGLMPGDEAKSKKARRAQVDSSLPQQLEEQKQRNIKLKAEIESLNGNLEKIKADYANLTTQFNAAKQIEQGLREVLEKKEDWFKKNEEAINKLQEEKEQLKKERKDKEDELAEEFSKHVDSTRGLRDLNSKYESLEQENKEKFETIERLQHKIEGYIEEVKNRNGKVKELENTIAEMKKKEAQSE